MSDSAARGERTPVGVGRHRCTQPGKGSVLVELRGGFGWYCFVFVLDAADPAGGSGILCMGGAAGAASAAVTPLQAEIVSILGDPGTSCAG